jgi:hypothetical protein
MPFEKIIDADSGNHTKPINILCGQNANILNVKTGGAYSYHCALKGAVA